MVLFSSLACAFIPKLKDDDEEYYFGLIQCVYESVAENHHGEKGEKGQ
jgi:hypothetical protein